MNYLIILVHHGSSRYHEYRNEIYNYNFYLKYNKNCKIVLFQILKYERVNIFYLKLSLVIVTAIKNVHLLYKNISHDINIVNLNYKFYIKHES